MLAVTEIQHDLPAGPSTVSIVWVMVRVKGHARSIMV